MGVEAIWSCNKHCILISSYLKVYIQNFVKKGQVVSSLSSEIWPLRQICQGQSMGIIYTHYDVLDVDATYKVSWGRTGLVVRASDSGSGDPGSILGRVGVLFPLARDIYSPKVLVIPRNRWLRLNMTEKLFTGALNHNQNKTKNKVSCKSV